MKHPLVPVNDWLRRQPIVTLVILGLGLVAAIGYVDYMTGPDLTPLTLYLGPVSLVAWYAGRAPGALIAAASGLSWLFSDMLTRPMYPHPAVPYWNLAARLAAFLIVALTIASLRGSVDHERELARTDPLTAVSNVRAFSELATAEIARARRYQHPFTIAYIDLDDFKTVNDHLGHTAGDALLRTVAQVLAGALRGSDSLARMGGDEFAILLPETGAAPARIVVQKLREVLADIVVAHGRRITASIGVATYLTPPEAVDEIVRSADALMYLAKRSGKNTVEHSTFN